MQVLIFKPELCDGCRICERTCSQTWFKEENPEKSAIRIVELPKGSGRCQAIICSQCGECMDICPTIAIRRDKQGIVRIQKALCVSCLSCVGFCPLEAMRVHADYLVPFKCVACGKCAKQCPTGALQIQELPNAELTETEKRLAALIAQAQGVTA
jgi:Fe-S-cluster-containing hydrogenase component 2